MVLALLSILMACGVASAGNYDAASGWTGAYMGIFAGSAQADNRITDIDGFANWGNPRSVSTYDNTGFIGGVLVGKKFTIGGVSLRSEFDAMFGDMFAKTNTLDPTPEGLDETAKAEFRWVATVRTGVEQTIGRVTVFATGGFAVGRIANSVTDIDFSQDIPRHIDHDDSFRNSSMEVGLVIGAGVEATLSEAWTLRLEGLNLDFGHNTYSVNHSGNNRCGPDNPQRPCFYDVENKLNIVRLAVIHRY